MILNSTELPASSSITSPEKFILLFLTLFLTVLLPLPNLLADDLPLNDSGGDGFYDDRRLNDPPTDSDTSPDHSKTKSLFTVVNEKNIFTDMERIRKSEVSTHIISPWQSDENKVTVSAVHSCTVKKSERHDALGGLINYEIDDFIFGAKYMLPFQFGEDFTDSQTQGEDAWGLSIKYQMAAPLLFDIHYEKSNSDILTDTISSTKQYGLAATYTFSFKTESDCNVTSGYRRVFHGGPAQGDKQADLNEFLIQFNWGF